LEFNILLELALELDQAIDIYKKKKTELETKDVALFKTC
jgi:hypothetical protein